MPDYPAQLGQNSNINLGGYVPAPVRNTSMQREVMQAMLEQIGGKLAGTAIDKLTTPDLAPAINQAMSSGRPVQFPKAAWYQEPANQAMMTQYSMQQPVSKQQARLTGAEAAKTEAGTPFVAPQAQAGIAATQAGTGLTQAETQRMIDMTPAQLDELRAQTGKTQAETSSISMMAPEQAALTRSETVKNVTAAQGQAAHNTAGYGAAEVAKLDAEAKDIRSQTGQREALGAHTGAETAASYQQMQRMREMELTNAYPAGKSREAATAAIGEFKRLHGVLPYDGDLNAYLQQMQGYVSRRVPTN